MAMPIALPCSGTKGGTISIAPSHVGLEDWTFSLARF
jgi:hypothetical protein